MVSDGGHSGKDIGENRGNPIITLGKLLTQLELDSNNNIYLNSIEGGTWVTAIPRDVECTITTDTLDLDKISILLDKLNKDLQNEYDNKNILVEISEIDRQNLAFDNNTTKKIIRYIANFPNGSILRNKNTNDTILSANLGTIWIENDTIIAENSIRSNINQQLTNQFIEKVKRAEDLSGLTTVDTYDFPGYVQDQDSEFIHYLINKYKNMFQRLPKLKEEHFLLECAWFAEKIPDLKYISISPNIENPHSPFERVSISSMQRIWEYVKSITRDLDKNYNLEVKPQEIPNNDETSR